MKVEEGHDHKTNSQFLVLQDQNKNLGGIFHFKYQRHGFWVYLDEDKQIKVFPPFKKKIHGTSGTDIRSSEFLKSCDVIGACILTTTGSLEGQR